MLHNNNNNTDLFSLQMYEINKFYIPYNLRYLLHFPAVHLHRGAGSVQLRDWAAGRGGPGGDQGGIANRLLGRIMEIVC